MKIALLLLSLVPGPAFALNCAGYESQLVKNYVTEDGNKKPGKLMAPVIEGLNAAKKLVEDSERAGERSEGMGGGDKGQAGFENQVNQGLDKASGEAEERFCKSLREVRERAHRDLRWMYSEHCRIDRVRPVVAKAFEPLEKDEKKICGRNRSGVFNKKRRGR